LPSCAPVVVVGPEFGLAPAAFCYDGAVTADSVDALRDDLARLAAAQPGLCLLVLFGSRARGDGRPESDWDFGYVADEAFDPDSLLAVLVTRLDSDRVDLVDLVRAGAQLRHRVAAEGCLVYAADEHVFPRFWLRAVSFWCDVEPVLRPGYHAVLSELGR
jgi:predicted nucleotidyltransferase